MIAPSPADKYRKQQEELERQREMLEQTKDFTFINQMLKALGMGEKR